MITTTLIMPVIAVSTAATIIFIGLGFLPRPSRATLYWSAAFSIAMVGAYVWLAQDFVAPVQMRALGSALTIAPMPLLWSGLRSYRGLARGYAWISIAWAVVAPTTLLATTYLGGYDVAFRVVFCTAGVFAVLISIDLVQLGPRQRDEALPLLAVSAGFIVLAVVTVVNGFFAMRGVVPEPDSLEFLRSLNLIGMTVYVICALVTTLLLTYTGEDAPRASRRSFEETARGRLDRARAQGDQSWSLLDIRLDDPDDIRLASSTAAYNTVTHKFARDLDSVLPADVDIERIRPDCFLVLVPRAQGSVRELATELLERISAPGSSDAFPIRVSASIGWAPVTAVGYDFDVLAASASEAAERAHDRGGDRWERVRDEAE
ncbi:GGDEF domain-containing protein [Microbacterium ginsengiterrae]|uniref:GGDEF domain-containing protein n=1 Tax=Microbacterium ginsengiterrae TaxID=546115 RepID=A0A7W9FBR0_9MICO|nr:MULTISPECIES: GGDEF domain-containing protein [Microbacterium]MBB5743425.1 GGDEF domain-containing protein [Microbacterium ginsengiterrae]